MYVTNLKIENDTLFIVVNEDLYEAEVYTEALIRDVWSRLIQKYRM